MDHDCLSSLLRINRRRIQLTHSALRPYGYVGLMHLILTYLHQHPGASQDDIAVFLEADKGSIARDARRLEEMGHIRREIDPENRRQYQLFLLPAGEEMLKVVFAVYNDFYSKMVRDLSEEERRGLTRLLGQMEKSLG